MKLGKRIVAILLSATLVLSCGLSASAKAPAAEGKPVSGFAHAVDSFFGVAHDAIFGALQNLLKLKNIPTADEYLKQNDPTFQPGTNGTARGSGWSGGFASGSVIPASWRCDADGSPDPDGMNLTKLHSTGGYQTKVDKLYTEQNMNMVILSNGADVNRNGKNDLIIFVSVDGVGITAASVREIRQSVLKALEADGVKAEDILSCNVSATHCHAGLDTQGMNIGDMLKTIVTKKIIPISNYIRILDKEMEESLCARAEACAKEAYAKMESGTLSFFETDKTAGVNDDLRSGVKTKNFFSCFLFEGQSGEKTFVTNIGAHPTSYGAWDNNHMLCCDYPYFMAMAMEEAGCHLVFTQSCQAAISSPGIDVEEGDAKDVEATEWVKAHNLTKEDWVARYGAKYADEWYDDMEADMGSRIKSLMKSGYLLTHFILDESEKAEELAPMLNVKNALTLLSLENGVLALGSISGLLGENVVKYSEAESGYGVYAETNYLEFGGSVVILTAPGELSPSLVYGTDPDYTGDSLWNGKTSWTGETWAYDTLIDTVRKVTKSPDKTVVLMGITNDALGYMFPDISTPKSLLGTILFYKGDTAGDFTVRGKMLNDMLLTIGTHCGSELMDGFTVMLRDLKK